MQNYEIALIINPDLSKDIDKFFISFERLLSDNSFSISRLDDVGRRKLAYSIDDHNKGHYLFYYVEGNPESVTEIESKILIYLITNKLCSKEYIKENILNIKPSIETNSVETHLTRIRKKFDFINTELIIKSKNNILSIDTNQKNLD